MNNGFLNNTAAAIIEKHGWRNMDDLTLVFPSRRAGVVFKDILKQYKKEHHAGAILLPAITTLPDLFDSLCLMATIEELEAVFRLYGIYAEETRQFYEEEKQRFEAENPGKKYDEVKPFNLDVFYSWGRQLLSDFNNIDSSDAAKTPDSVHQFFDNAIQAKNLEGLKIDDDVRERLQTLLHVRGNNTYLSASTTCCLWRKTCLPSCSKRTRTLVSIGTMCRVFRPTERPTRSLSRIWSSSPMRRSLRNGQKSRWKL